MSPESRLLVFFTHENEIVPDAMNFKMNKCFRNRINFELATNSIRVGRRLNLTIRTEPKSLCALTAIDKSVTFMGKRNSIDIEKVHL